MKLSGRPGRTWVEEAFRDHHRGRWIMAARLWIQHGQLVIGELRVYPSDRREGGKAGADERSPLAAGNWSEDPEKIPRGGLASQVLRYIPLGGVRPYVLAAVNRAESLPPGDRELHRSITRYVLAGSDVLEARPRPERRAGRGDLFYARLANSYVQAIAGGSRRPTTDLARHRGEPAARVATWLHEARVRGLLSPGEPGVRGGHLLPRAVALLKTSRRRPRRSER
jgi:hypothetical protein